jgi:hypothetical protein
MAEEKVELRDLKWHQLVPWTELFRGFHVALDPKKLLLAAAGILVMACSWYILSAIFFHSRAEPSWDLGHYGRDWAGFESDRRKWNLLYQAAGPDDPRRWTDANDLAASPAQYDAIKKELDRVPADVKRDIAEGKRPPLPLKVAYQEGEEGPSKEVEVVVRAKPAGQLRQWPFYEDRGPNPYLLVTGQAGRSQDGAASYTPWASGHFWDWLLTKQFPVLIEPLVKFLRPGVYLLHPSAGFWNRIYFILVLLSTLATWALFGGAITRMAAVQIARKEKIGMGEAIRFTLARYVSFFSAPLFPLLGVLFFVVCLIIFGILHLIPAVGDIVVDGLGWPLVLLAGGVMAVLLVGLIGWPMMYATISAEGSDSFDALSRSYSYVLQSPWHYLWYSLVALGYGAVVVFFVGFMGSLVVYLGKWGIDQTPFITNANRQPEYLFVYAPTSFHWRELLLQGSSALAPDGTVRQSYLEEFRWYNTLGMWMVTVWLYIFFLLVLGFGYSYFWSASTIIYLLMRRKVDDTELDEVYLEEEETEDVYPAATPGPTGSPQGAAPTGLTMVEPPTLKTATPSNPAPPRPEGAQTDKGDGNPPGEGTVS